MAALLQKPMNRGHAWVAISLTLFLWLAIMLVIFLAVYTTQSVRLPLRQAPVAVQLPKFMPVKSSVNNQLTTQMNHTLDFSVPVDQHVKASLPEVIPVDIDLKTQVDLNTEIQYQDEFLIDTTFEMMAPIDHPLIPFDIPVKLPLVFTVPVDLSVPVNTTIPLNLKTKVYAHIKDPVPAHLQATINTKVPVKTQLNTAIISKADVLMTLPTAPVELNLTRADLDIPLTDITLLKSAPDHDEQAAVFIYDADKKPPLQQ